jgi:prepilin-type N-terminal cleavage/methylation domain-containing protein
MRLRKNRGFSLLELMIVIAIGLTMAGVTFMALMPLFKKNHVDQAYDTTLSVLRNYRNLAITQGNRYIITFPTTQSIQVQLWGYSPPPAASPAPVTVATIPLPKDIQFAVQVGFPNPGPDNLSTGATAIFTTYPCTIVESGNPCLIFYPDGSSEDDASTPGNFNSGVIYLTRPGDVYSSRAIDVWGTTGRIRGWRLYNQAGVNTWVQQ